MSRILVDQIRSNSASADAITLDGSGNLTIPGNATCSGTATGFGIGGKVLQAVSAVTTSQVSTTGETFISSNLTASITPTSSSNKVLIMTSSALQTRGDGSNASGKIGEVRLCRGDHTGTALATNEFGGAWMSAHASLPRVYHMGSFVFLDSPNTTSAQAYTVAIKCNQLNCTTYAQDGSRESSIILLEVSA